MNIKTIYISTIIATIIVSCGKKEIPPFAHSIVSPLLTAYTAWTQEESPYNDFTPNNYPAGCVNIALGKILAYFNGPLTITYQGITLN